MAMLSSTDLGITIDFGTGHPDEFLQRLEEGEWVDCLVDGKQATQPFDYRELPPGKYRMTKAEKERQPKT